MYVVPPGQEQRILIDLQNESEVEYAEFNELAAAIGTANDSMLANQWHLANISSQKAWDLIFRITPGFNMYNNNLNMADIQGHGTAAEGSAVVDTNNSVDLS